MKYEAKNFERLLGLKGFSDNALKTHFLLYQGYVNNTNKLLDELKSAVLDSPQHAEMQRRFGWEFNGMRLHEYFFESLSKEAEALDEKTALHKKIESGFESFENWEKEFRAIALARGIGWGIVYYDTQADKLLNVWVNEHDQGHLVGLPVILNIDVFEHAFMLDYGTKRADYIDAFMKAVDWKVVAERFKSAKA
jgi:Fe-Mn family superoxide dismutase